MRRSLKLRPLATLAERSERQEANKLGEHRWRLTQALAQRKQLAVFRTDYERQQFDDSSLSASKLKNMSNFMSQLDCAIEAADGQVHMATAGLRAQEAQWRKARAKAEALSQLVERLHRAERLDAQRAEQRFLDEAAQHTKGNRNLG